MAKRLNYNHCFNAYTQRFHSHYLRIAIAHTKHNATRRPQNAVFGSEQLLLQPEKQST